MDDYKEKFEAFIEAMKIPKKEELVEENIDAIKEVGKRFGFYAKMGASCLEACTKLTKEFHEEYEEGRG